MEKLLDKVNGIILFWEGKLERGTMGEYCYDLLEEIDIIRNDLLDLVNECGDDDKDDIDF